MYILYPLFAMVLLTLLFNLHMLRTRVKAVNSGAITMEYFRVFRGAEPPDFVVQASRHWSNLFEAPVLFYAACILSVAIGLHSTALVILAWCYVAARLAHTLVHAGYNTVMHRLICFAASQTVLAVMWAVLFVHVVSA